MAEEKWRTRRQGRGYRKRDNREKEGEPGVGEVAAGSRGESRRATARGNWGREREWRGKTTSARWEREVTVRERRGTAGRPSSTGRRRAGSARRSPRRGARNEWGGLGCYWLRSNQTERLESESNQTNWFEPRSYPNPKNLIRCAGPPGARVGYLPRRAPAGSNKRWQEDCSKHLHAERGWQEDNKELPERKQKATSFGFTLTDWSHNKKKIRQKKRRKKKRNLSRTFALRWKPSRNQENKTKRKNKIGQREERERGWKVKPFRNRKIALGTTRSKKPFKNPQTNMQMKTKAVRQSPRSQ